MGIILITPKVNTTGNSFTEGKYHVQNILGEGVWLVFFRK